jgi:hypothetical protein
MPVASLMYLIPVLPLYAALLYPVQWDVLLLVFFAASFLFRTAHASVFGTLNALGQLAIESDERRAVVLSMSSGLASLLVALVLLLLVRQNLGNDRAKIAALWECIALPAILMLAIGGYLVALRRRS